MMPRARVKNSDIRRDDGFTLLETLVSIMLLALVVAFLPGLLRLGTRAMQSRTELDAISAAGPARQFIAQQLSGATAVLQRRSGGRLQLAFDGRRDELGFVAPASLGAQQTGMQDYRIALVTGGDGAAGTPQRSLSVAMRPFALQGSTPATSSVLLRDVTALSFRYFGRRSGDDGARWHDEWSGASALPQLVEMQLGFLSLQPAAERPLVVVLRFAHGD
jgi:prepilin-type N-terminal cleavage/methylation domain-containing protein